jgi:NAD(P)-dependent dehydrogenase (short-subunit alcohol dehydrogenase family)
MSLTAKRILITGSSRGIGRGIALKLAKPGARIAIHYYQNESAASATRAKVREGFTVQSDVPQPEELEALFRRVEVEFGALDAFVSNARPELLLPTNRRRKSCLTGGTRHSIPRPGRS